MIAGNHQNLTIIFECPIPKPGMLNGRIHKIPHIPGYDKHIANGSIGNDFMKRIFS